MPESIWMHWKRMADEKSGQDAIIHWSANKKELRITYDELLVDAKKNALLLKKLGVNKNDVCALIITHHPGFYALYLGVAALGAIPAVLAYPNPRLHPDKFRMGIKGMSQRSGLDYILTEENLMPMLSPLLENKENTIKEILLPLNHNLNNINTDDFSDPVIEDVRQPFLLQHSSGTTGLQKPVIISHDALLKHAECYGKALKVSQNDKVVSWLPLYHDMGLIASFHLPLLWGIPSVQIDPFEWIIAPEIMIEAISAEKASMAWMPNFAFNLMTEKIHDDDIWDCSMKSMRLLINSSEPIRHNSIDIFCRKFKKTGFMPAAISTLYGMAETTMAVTQTPADEAPVIVKADRKALTSGIFRHTDSEEDARYCVSSGKIIDGCKIKIVDDSCIKLHSGSVGEIAVQSVSLFEGYRNYPEKTAEVLCDHWFYTGDIGFEINACYFIIGRKKDIIISAGKNIYPEDIEDVVGRVKGVIPGRVVAFGEDNEVLGTELLGIVAETHVDDDFQKQILKVEIIRAGMDIDVSISEVYLVPPRWLIKSSAGKPARNANKERLLVSEENQKWRIL